MSWPAPKGFGIVLDDRGWFSYPGNMAMHTAQWYPLHMSTSEIVREYGVTPLTSGADPDPSLLRIGNALRARYRAAARTFAALPVPPSGSSATTSAGASAPAGGTSSTP